MKKPRFEHEVAMILATQGKLPGEDADASFAEVSGTGKWRMPGVPHKGWVCVGEEDLGEPSETCEMCEARAIRYVQIMQHADYPAVLRCGCVCAGHMSQDLAGATARDKSMRSRADAVKRRAKRLRQQREQAEQERQTARLGWLRRPWLLSARGNQYLNIPGYNITIFERRGGDFGWTVRTRSTNTVKATGVSATIDEAKLASFDALGVWRG